MTMAALREAAMGSRHNISAASSSRRWLPWDGIFRFSVNLDMPLGDVV